MSGAQSVGPAAPISRNGSDSRFSKSRSIRSRRRGELVLDRSGRNPQDGSFMVPSVQHGAPASATVARSEEPRPPEGVMAPFPRLSRNGPADSWQVGCHETARLIRDNGDATDPGAP
jgi:hypothetical protein